MSGTDVAAWKVNPYDYGFEQDLGSGTFGDVTLVSKRQSRDRFACRAVSPLLDRRKASAEFEQAVEILARVGPHPVVCGFHGWYYAEDQGLLFEYLPLGSLSRVLKSPPSERPEWFTPTVQAKVVFGVAAGMQHLHSHRITHKYLNPNNILFDSNCEPRIVDFCFGRFSRELNSRPWGDPADPVPYLAPDALETDGPWSNDPSVDLFSFAVILAYLVTGEPRSLPNPRELPYPRGKGDPRDRWRSEWHPPKLPECPRILSQIIQHRGFSRGFTRFPFDTIVDRLLENREPLFPGVDMREYLEYCRRVMEREVECSWTRRWSQREFNDWDDD
jgi:serine/threonine protein kinase